MKHLGGDNADSVTWRVLRTVAGGWALDGFHMFSVLSKATGEWIGRIGPLYPHGWPDREIGWRLIFSFAGQGLAHVPANSSPRMVPVDVANWSTSIPIRCSIDTYRFGSG